jgi:polar amino acid transport system ATP-binding protein
MLMVTHEIAFARDASDRIVFMADGKVSAQGAPKDLPALVAENERLKAFLSRFHAAAAV